jgi:outer membrane protein assembly factor BamB
MRVLRQLTFGVGFLLFAARITAGDWTHYRGPGRDGIALEACPLPARGGIFREVWRARVGVGTSSSTVAGNRLYTVGHSAGQEIVQCLDTASGKQIWKFSHPVSLDPNLFEGGSRSTPTITKEGVYVLSHEGHLHCLNPESGAVVWERHLVRDFGGRKPEWGFSGAPLVDGDHLIVDCGGPAASTVALNRLTGQPVWRSGTEAAGYASPVILPLEPVPALVLFKAGGLFGCNPEDGRVLWSFPWETSYQINAATPVRVGSNKILISSGYNTGAALVSVVDGKASQVWRNKNLRCHINSPVIWGDAVFGIDGNTGGGNLVCLNPNTGEKRWEEKSVKGGALIAAGGALIIVSEKGDLVVAEASSQGFRQLHRQPVLKSRTWAQPVLAHGRIYVRDNVGNLSCLSP